MKARRKHPETARKVRNLCRRIHALLAKLSNDPEITITPEIAAAIEHLHRQVDKFERLEG
jgi:hypothetical protein